jgi:subtilisin family serine protease
VSDEREFIRGKLDARLHHRLLELERSRSEHGEAHDPALDARLVGVWVRFTGDLEPARQAGFHAEVVAGEVATGTIAVASLERVAACEGVLSIQEVQQYHSALNNSVPAIHADHSDVVTVGGGSGAKVIIGIVDTGIDIFHHNFRKPDGTTRILALLDITLRQAISCTGPPTGGTFTLAWAGTVKKPLGNPVPATAAIPFNATAAAVQAALLAMRTGTGAIVFNAGDLQVDGGPLPGKPITVDFQGQYADKEVSAFAPTSALTGGFSPAVQITRGREFMPPEIDAALANPAQTFASTDFGTHGTHVAGIAAGNGSEAGYCRGAGTFVGVATEADLVIVKYSARTTDVADPIVRGTQYVFTQAGMVGKPAVVNLSLGGNVGAHDGTGVEETALNEMLTDTSSVPLPGRAIVVAAGNEGRASDTPDSDQRARHHARKHVAANSPGVTFSFAVPAGATARTLIDMWYEGAARLTCTVTPPPAQGGGAAFAAGGPVGPPATSGAAVPTALPLASIAPNQPAAADAEIWYTINAPPVTWPNNASPRAKHEIVLRIAAPPALPGAPAPPPGTIPPPNPIAQGTWTITLAETAGTAADVDAWISMDPEQVSAGKQPIFASGDADRTRTLTIPGTAANAITVASYDYRDNTLSPFSGRGPTLNSGPGAILKPDIAAPGAGIISAIPGKANVTDPGCWCHCCYTFYTPKNGTSMAAPHVAGIVALIFGKNKHLTFLGVRQALLSGALPPDPITGPTLPNADWGAGIVDAEKVLGGVVAQALAGGGTQLASIKISDGAAWPATAPTTRRLSALRASVAAHPAGPLVAALVSTHVDEVMRLVNSNRRILVVWHRMQGPQLLREAMRYADGRPVRIPASPSGRPLLEWLEKLLDLLHEYGSPALRADVTRHRTVALGLARALTAGDARMAG